MSQTKTKPNLFINPSTAFNSGSYSIDSFKKILKDDKNCYLTSIATTQSYLTRHAKDIFGYEISVKRPNWTIVKNPTNMDFDNGTFIIYDLETTGLHGKYDHITEIGAIKVTMKNDKEVKREEFQRFVKQDKPLKPFISKLTHITDEMLNTQGVPETQALKEFMEFCGDSPCIGHNIINFDSRFIDKRAVENGMVKENEHLFKNAQIDTMEVSKLFNKRPNHTLRSMAQDLDITYDPKYQHRAIADVIVNWEVFKQTCIPEFKKHGVTNVGHINDLIENNIIYESQHHLRNAIVYLTEQAKNRLFRLVQDNNLNYSNLFKESKNMIITNHPTSTEIIDSYISDSKNKFIETINKYDFIVLPPPSFWTNIISTTLSSKTLDLTNKNDALIYNNRNELQKLLIKCTSDEQRVEALGKSEIFKDLNINQGNVYSILSKIDYITNPLCKIKKDPKSKTIDIIYSTDAALTLKQVQDAYTNIINICKAENKKIIIDNEITVPSKKDIPEFVKNQQKRSNNPYKKFIKNVDGCKTYKFTNNEIEKEMSFLNNKELIEEICFKNPQEIYKQILNLYQRDIKKAR